MSCSKLQLKKNSDLEPFTVLYRSLEYALFLFFVQAMLYQWKSQFIPEKQDQEPSADRNIFKLCKKV